MPFERAWRKSLDVFGRGAVLGAGYGLATACFEIWFGVQKVMGLRMPPTPGYTAKAAALEVAFGAVLGLIAAPLLRVRRHPMVVHAFAVALAWLALERAVAPDPSKVPMWAAPPLVGLTLMGAGTLLARWRRFTPWLLGVFTLAAAVVVPLFVHQRHVSETESAHAATQTPWPSSPAHAGDHPDVLIVVLDTVRAQSVSAYGYARRTTPYLERLASEGAVFLDATSPSTWSLPSHASLFTGRFPSSHGAHSEHRFLDADVPTIAEVLSRNGYVTNCFTANPHISDGFGLTRGFQFSDRAWLSASGARSFVFAYRVLDLLGVSASDKGGGVVARNFEQWLDADGANSAPTFTFINFLEAHFPYHQIPRQFLSPFTTRSRYELRSISLAVFGAQFGRPMDAAEVKAAAEPSRDMYDAGVAYSDYLLSRVVEALRRSGKLDHTILVVLADHGELVGEHDQFGHGAAVYEEGIRVPLLIRYPPRVRAGARVEVPVSTVGVFATVLDLAQLEAPPGLQVGSLLPALRGEPAGAPVLSERHAFPEERVGTAALAMPDRRYRVYRSGSKKLVRTSRGELFLFDLATDPGETHDRAAEHHADTARLDGELTTWVGALGLPALDAAPSTKAAPALDPAARERLKALGYTN